jgi:hypothetical protein
MVQPWFARKYPTAAESDRGRLRIRYAFEVGAMPQGALHLALERPDAWSVSLNGTPLRTEAAAGFWLDAAFPRFPLEADAFREGENLIELEGDYDAGAGIEALYLLGDFGVRIEGLRRILGELPPRLLPSCLTGQGLPFYGGRISYQLDAPAPEGGAPTGRRILEVTFWEGACLALVQAGKRRVIPWPPFLVELEPEGGKGLFLDVVLTRRNTFGPLHLLPSRAPGYGPESFRTEGPAWSEAPVPIAAGLLAPLRLLIE